MKEIYKKLILTLVVVLIGVTVILLLRPKGNNYFGQIQLIIEDEEVVYDNFLDFKENETLYDLLNNNFEVIERDYAIGVIILNIKGEDFEVITDFEGSYLAFYEVLDGKEEYFTVSAKDFYLQDEMVILIRMVLL